MKRIDEIFTPHRARSDIFSRYKLGTVPYIGNGLSDNAVVGLVTPLSTDKVFKFVGIALSAFCEASVQAPPFVACGRAGNGMVVLESIKPMTTAQLAWYAAYINKAVRWRFSWYWQTTADRIRRLMVPDEAPGTIAFSVQTHMPTMCKPLAANAKMTFQQVALGTIYDLKAGDYHSFGNLPAGKIPIISCGDLDNGICGYFDVDRKHVYRNKMTIAFNGSTLSAKYHPYDFAAKDDVAICSSKQKMRLTTEMFIQVMLRREQWRFSYYRKCYKDKLERVTVPLPMKGGQIDEDAIQEVMKTTPYWQYLGDKMGSGQYPA